jgi:hypothetical protein
MPAEPDGAPHFVALPRDACGTPALNTALTQHYTGITKFVYVAYPA